MKEKKKFNIYKLIVFIIILLVVIFIVIPLIDKLVTKYNSGKLDVSLWKVDSAVELYYYNSILKDDIHFLGTKQFKIEDNKANDNIYFNTRNVKHGYIAIYNNGISAICIDDGVYFASKGVSGSSSYGKGICNPDYDEMMGEYKIDK